MTYINMALQSYWKKMTKKTVFHITIKPNSEVHSGKLTDSLFDNQKKPHFCQMFFYIISFEIQFLVFILNWFDLFHPFFMFKTIFANHVKSDKMILKNSYYPKRLEIIWFLGFNVIKKCFYDNDKSFGEKNASKFLPVYFCLLFS